MSTTTERFIRAFEDLKSEINRRANADSSTRFEIEKASDRDRAVQRDRALLVYTRDIRNALQHPRHASPGSAIIVSEAFLAEVQGLLNRLRNPPTAGRVGVQRRDLLTARPTDRLGELAAAMKRNGFSHVPILNEQDVVLGVFNEAAVFDHLWADDETIVGRQMQVSEILRHCSLDAGHTESFRFVSSRTPLDDLVEMFLAVQTPTTRIGAVFVTASGKQTEPLLRLITPWDVLATGANGS